MICSGGSKLELVSVNTRGVEQGYRRNSVQIKHAFNFFRVNILMLMASNDVLVQDSTGIYMFSLNFEKNTPNPNRFIGGSPRVLIFQNEIVGIEQGSLNSI